MALKTKILVTLTKGEDGFIIAECPSLPGCVSQGKTKQEAIANIKEAIEGILELRRDQDLPKPEPSEAVTVEIDDAA